jgi:hypothetical protein
LEEHFSFSSNWLMHLAVHDFLYCVVLDDLLFQGLL